MERKPVRWGLVFVSVLVGMFALARAVQWYFDPARTPERPAANLPPPTTPVASAAAMPAPADEEIALLGSVSADNRLLAARTLRGRAVTPAVEQAVDSALSREQDTEIRAELVCLKAAASGLSSIDFLVGAFPADPLRLNGQVAPDVLCVLDALVERIKEAPERITPVLVPAVYSNNLSIRARALGAFRQVDVAIPEPLVAEAGTAGHPYRREALAAVMALGGARKSPDVVAKALADDQLRPIVMAEPALRK